MLRVCSGLACRAGREPPRSPAALVPPTPSIPTCQRPRFWGLFCRWTSNWRPGMAAESDTPPDLLSAIATHPLVDALQVARRNPRPQLVQHLCSQFVERPEQLVAV